MQNPVTALFGKLKFFQKNQSGNMAMLFCLSAIPVLLAAGAAIDYARVANAKANLVAGLDSASLYSAAVVGKSEADLKVLARQHFDQNYNNTRDAAVTGFRFRNSDDDVEVSGTVNVRTWFMGVGGIHSVDVNATSEVLKRGNNVEVSLVLDVTGSMEGSKLASLKNAANSFVDKVVWENQTSHYAKVALVPFSEAVNMGDRAELARGPLLPGACVSAGCEKFDRGGGNTYTATNCVTERLGRQSYTDAPVSANPVGRHYLEDNRINSKQAECTSIEPLVPLSNDKAALHRAINALQASGSTAGQVGLAWGWYTISPTFGLWTGDSIPAAYPSDNTQLKKIAVFMTDGLFNQAYCDGLPSGNACPANNGDPVSQANALCEAMKASGITIYTIGFQLNDATASNFMQTCASDKTRNFAANSEAELQVAFAEIAKSLIELRLSR